MKRFSIKTRVTIWYVSFLVLVVSLLFASSIYTANYLIQKDIKGDLAAIVTESVRNVTVEKSRLEIDDDMISYRDHVYVLVYQENNFLVTGTLPTDLQTEIPFTPGEVRKVRDGGKEFYVYDHLISKPNFGDVWVRGITSATLSESDPAAAFMLKFCIVLLPLLILFAALGGYYITKRAFRPVAQITRTAHDIETSQDLSQRIGFEFKGGTRDEIYDLAMTFDKMLDRLESAFISEKQFASDASHELRTPISVIIAECEYALDKAQSLEDSQSALEVILSQAQKMSGLIAQLLTLARADKDIEKLEFEDLNLSEIVIMVVLEQEILAAEKNVSILHEIEPDLFSKVDQTMVMRLFVNLISNGIRYNRENGFVKVTLRKEGDFITAQIIDNGIGIDPEKLPRVWDRFYQVDSSRSSESMGLGLSMARWIVEAHRGNISISSKLGEGTTVTLSLPVR